MAVSEEDLKKAHLRYNEAVKIKSTKLVELDEWYREDLPAVIEKRKATKEGVYLTTEELVKLMRWKLTRGKFRPRLEQMAQSNDNALVRSQTKKAFELLSESDSIDTAKEALTALSVLRGIGPATSSAILALFRPETLPFMSDEALEYAADLGEKPKYSVKEWKWYTEQMQQRREKENWSDGVKQIEEAAWSYAMLTRNGLWESEEPPKKRAKKSK